MEKLDKETLTAIANMVEKMQALKDEMKVLKAKIDTHPGNPVNKLK